VNQIYFILEWHSTCFGRSFHPSSAVQDCTYSNQTDTATCLLTGISVCTVLNCWWWMERLSETCRGHSTRFGKFDTLMHLVGVIIEIILWWTGLWTSNLFHIHCYGIQYSISCSTYLLLNVLHIRVRLYFLAIWIKLHFFYASVPLTQQKYTLLTTKLPPVLSPM